ncbi:hypothetical protein DI270_029415 [Microbispora triticiradicis]|uniref:Uncharacterized protein n=1 Tax=Microbispora triticiradicis TaxID=2200763 RepID=A0ABX9LCT6_9ACTN|nr:hypothetical protein DI270_029415 [Microbispora triticiradicis]GLW26642.1 hypothetical protein Mame01_66840 [Microbispora amethystogenes]
MIRPPPTVSGQGFQSNSTLVSQLQGVQKFGEPVENVAVLHGCRRRHDDLPETNLRPVTGVVELHEQLQHLAWELLGLLVLPGFLRPVLVRDGVVLLPREGVVVPAAAGRLRKGHVAILSCSSMSMVRNAPVPTRKVTDK